MNEFAFDIPELLSTFAELLPLTNEELGHYWLRHHRDDGFSITLILSIYESKVGLLLNRGDTEVASLSFSRCRCVRLGGRCKDLYTIEILGSEGNPDAFCAVRLVGFPVIIFSDKDLGSVPFPV
jgi:hypothetical protein